MVRAILNTDNDIIVDGISFKRLCKVQKQQLKESHGVDIALSNIQDMLSVGLGYVSFHEMRQTAANLAESLKPVADPHEASTKFFIESAERRAAWVKPACPPRLLEKRSLRWIDTALRVSDGMLWHMSRPSVLRANITIIIGQDSSLVLRALSGVYKNPKYFSLKHGTTLEDVHLDVEQQIARHQLVIDAAVKDKRFTGAMTGKADGGYQCIAGLAESNITDDVLRDLVRISELDPRMQMAINIERADLLKFSTPDLNKPHFHYLTIIDLDRIDDTISFSTDNKSFNQYPQPTYGVWVNPKTRHETLFPHIEYRPQQSA